MNDALVAFAVFVGFIAIVAPIIVYLLWKQDKKGNLHA